MTAIRWDLRVLRRSVAEVWRLVVVLAGLVRTFQRAAGVALIAYAAGLAFAYKPLTVGVVTLLIVVLLWARFATVSWERYVAGPARRRRISRFVRRSWPVMALRCGLSVPGDDVERTTTPLVRHRAVSWQGDRLAVRIELLIGQSIDDVIDAADRLTAAAGARSVTVEPLPKGARLWFSYADALSAVFDAPMPTSATNPDTSRVLMGRTETGGEFVLPLGPQTLLVGASGSGKASLIWSFVAGLAPAIRDGLVEVHAVDLKGGMELSMGAALFTRFARTPVEAVALLEDAVAATQARAGRLSGVTRQHTPAVGEPLVVVLVDELAAITAYLTDRDLKSRAAFAIGLLCSQGRAVGYMMFGALQDPRKETLPSRGLFTQMIGLRLKDAEETRMVLGDGASAAGARCHQIPRAQPGVGFMVPEDGSAPVRFRAGYVDDDAIRYLATGFPAPGQVPIVVPASGENGAQRVRGRRGGTDQGEAA
jgi:S-DNA-T family DNA segregation ATPase FtsK/SpoIIIE